MFKKKTKSDKNARKKVYLHKVNSQITGDRPIYHQLFVNLRYRDELFDLYFCHFCSFIININAHHTS
jgi:hypothetical protein